MVVNGAMRTPERRSALNDVDLGTITERVSDNKDPPNDKRTISLAPDQHAINAQCSTSARKRQRRQKTWAWNKDV